MYLPYSVTKDTIFVFKKRDYEEKTLFDKTSHVLLDECNTAKNFSAIIAASASSTRYWIYVMK